MSGGGSMKAAPAIALSLTGWDAAVWAERLRQAAPGRDIIVAAGPDDPLPQRYHLLCWKPPREVLHRSPKPMLILSAGAGVDHILKHEPPAGIPITRIVDPDLTGRMVEYVVLHCLYHLRRMNEAAANQAQKCWTAPVFPPARSVTVGLMGVGEMGQASARGLMAVGFNVIGWGRSPRAGLPFPSSYGAEALGAFLAATDILVSTLPSTPQTRGLIDATVIGKLRRDGPFGPPVLINAGRGDTADEADVLQALSDGTLRAASLDVFATEPLPASSPFWALPNVVVTPHNAADSDPEALTAAILDEIARFESGAPLLNPVYVARGY